MTTTDYSSYFDGGHYDGKNRMGAGRDSYTNNYTERNEDWNNREVYAKQEEMDEVTIHVIEYALANRIECVDLLEELGLL